MQRLFLVTAMIFAVSGLAHAQDPSNNVDELNRKYQDALVQLKAAQDRKNELATENEKLTAHVADLQKQLDEANRQASTFAQQTFQLRANYAAWEAFMKRYPLLLGKWKVFIESDPLALPSEWPDMVDPLHPLPTTQAGTTQPTTAAG